MTAFRKTTVLIIICLSSAVGVFAGHQADTYIGDMRLAAMAGAYTAVADDHNALFRNPAGLGMLQSQSIGTMLHYADMLQQSGSQFFEPAVMPQFFFTGPGWGVSISSTYDLSMDEDTGNGDRTYTISKINNVDLGFGVNLGMFSVGTSIHASKITEASNVNLSDPKESDFFADFFQQVFLNEYNGNQDESGESVLLRGGMLFDTGIIAVGAHHDKILDVMAWSHHQDLPELEDLVKDIHVGLSLRNPRLDRYGRRNIIRFLGAADVDHIGCDDRRKLRLGAESGVYFTENDRLVLRFGYKEDVPRIQDLMFGAVNPSRGIISVGAGLELTALSVQTSFSMPAQELFNAEKEESRFGISAGFVF